MKAKCLRSMPRNGGTAKPALEFLKQCHEALWSAGHDRHGQVTVIPGSDEGDRQCCRPDLRSLAEQPGGKLTSALSKAGRGNGSVQRHQDPTEIRLHSRLDPQPLQPPTPSQPPRHFQTNPSHRPGRVASTCCLKVLYYGFFRSGLVSLTMPGRGLRKGYQDFAKHGCGQKSFRCTNFALRHITTTLQTGVDNADCGPMIGGHLSSTKVR